jgi:signal transduction histidine kinase/CheY-like chemotaxis protein
VARLRWTIKRKLLALGIGTFLPLLLLLAFWVGREFREHTETAQTEMALASQQAASQVEELLGQMLGHLHVLARNPAVLRRRVAQMEDLFHQALLEHPGLENVFAVAADGHTLATAISGPTGERIEFAGRPWFQQVMATGVQVVGDFQTGRFSGQPVAAVAVPLRDENGAIVGALAAGLSLRRLQRLFQSLPLVPEMTVTVVDGGGRVLSHHPMSDGGWPGRRLPSALPVRSGRAAVTRLAWFEGGDRVAAVAPVAESGWRVLAGIPRASIENRVRRDVTAISLPLIGLLAGSGLIGFVIARRIWRPLQALTEAAGQLPREEPSPLRVDSTDEVGELARAFNAMAAQIEESRSSLEQRVSELTALSGAGRLLTGTLESEEVLQRLTELVRTRLDADAVRIWLQEKPSGEFRLAAHAGTVRGLGEDRMRLAPGEGLVGWIMDRREPLALDDVQGDARLRNREWTAAEGVHSFLGVPIVLGRIPVGVLTCLSRRRQAFSADQLTLLRLLAEPAAVAILNARLYEEAGARTRELENRTRQLELLHETARAIVAERDLDRLLQRIVESAREAVGARYGALSLFGADGQIRRFFTAGLSAEDVARLGPLPEGRGLLGHVFKQGEPLRLDDMTRHPAFSGFPPGHPPMQSLLAMPISFRGGTIGALYLAEKAGGFTATDESLIAALAADAAVAIDNARLVQSLRDALDDLKLKEEQLVQGEALRAVGHLASGMAHHLNNVFAIVRGRTQLLLRAAGGPSLHRSLEIVERAAMEGADVVRRLQTFSITQPAPEVVPADLNRIVRDVVELTRPQWQDEARKQGIEIEMKLELDAIRPVSGNHGAIGEALVNLILNAVEALSTRGQIRVKTWATADQVHCSVSDTGAGMPEEVRQQALEPFFTTKGPKSRGLGLSMSYGIVQRHGGTLNIESRPGYGTTVTISLPVSTAATATAPPQLAPPPTVSPRRILVIDDDVDVRETTADLLAAEGHSVSQAASGAEGVSMFRTHRYDVVFTDLGMPGMTGWEVAEAIKALNPATRIVLLTGWGEEIGQAAPQRGCVDQIAGKPLDLAAVAPLIAAAPVRKPG